LAKIPDNSQGYELSCGSGDKASSSTTTDPEGCDEWKASPTSAVDSSEKSAVHESKQAKSKQQATGVGEEGDARSREGKTSFFASASSSPPSPAQS